MVNLNTESEPPKCRTHYLQAHHLCSTSTCEWSLHRQKTSEIFLDLSFGACGADHGKLGVNADTDFEKASNIEIGVVIQNVIGYACALREAAGHHVLI